MNEQVMNKRDGAMEEEILVLFGETTEYRVRECQPAIIRQGNDINTDFIVYEVVGDKLRFMRSFVDLESSVKYVVKNYK